MTDTAVTIASAHGDLTATFLPTAGMICSSLSHHGEEQLAQRAGLEGYLERGSSFALPLLYPWANRLSGWEYTFAGVHVELDRNEPLIHQDAGLGLPMHGVMAATADWKAAKLDDSRLHAVLDYGADPRRLAAFPFPHTIDYVAEVDPRQLSVALTITPTGELAVPISFGFHPYLALGSDRRGWTLSGPVDGLDGLLADRRFDDGFGDIPEDARFSVADQQSRLEVAFEAGFDATQVFSPAGAQFICFEPMTAPTDALRTGEGLRSVVPGERFTAAFTIRVG